MAAGISDPAAVTLALAEVRTGKRPAPDDGQRVVSVLFAGISTCTVRERMGITTK
jgi:hypothetical protein